MDYFKCRRCNEPSHPHPKISCTPQSGQFILHYNQTNSDKQSIVFVFSAKRSLSLSLFSVSFYVSLTYTAFYTHVSPLNFHFLSFFLHLSVFLSPSAFLLLFSIFFQSYKRKKVELYRMTYKCREFYCTKNAEPCAPPVFVRGNCRSQGFGIVTTTEQDPFFYCWKMKRKKATHDFCRMSQKRKRKKKRIWFHKLACCILKVMAP